MAQEVREYFKNFSLGGQGRTVQTGNQLARGGIEDMDTLCTMLKHEPERLLKIRNIGPRSMAIVQSVCAAYRSERGDAL